MTDDDNLSSIRLAAFLFRSSILADYIDPTNARDILRLLRGLYRYCYYFMQFVPLTGLVSANVFYSELRLVVARHRYETSTYAVIAAHR